MHMKATAIAPSNIAFVKYMGRKDEILRLPENASISMCLSDLLTTTTVEFSDAFDADNVTINGEYEDGEATRVIKHLDRIRSRATVTAKARVVSTNTFPIGTGLSSSASGFAALTVAGVAAAGLTLSERELSILARQGSGSACRSIPSGFVLWHDADTSEGSFAETIFPPHHWDIVDVVAIASSHRKFVTTSDAHIRVANGPYYGQRIARMPSKIEECQRILTAKDFHALGQFVEEEALDLHAIFMTAGIIYLTPESLMVIAAVRTWRQEGLNVFFTVNTGQDVHILCERKNVAVLQEKLKSLACVQKVIVNSPAEGTRLSDKHLF